MPAGGGGARERGAAPGVWGGHAAAAPSGAGKGVLGGRAWLCAPCLRVPAASAGPGCPAVLGRSVLGSLERTLSSGRWGLPAAFI